MTAGIAGARAVARALGSAIGALARAMGLASHAARIRATFVVPRRSLTFVAPARLAAFVIPARPVSFAAPTRGAALIFAVQARPLSFVVAPGPGATGVIAGEGESMRATFQTVDGTSFLNPLDQAVPFTGDISAILPGGSGVGATVAVYAVTGIPQDGSASFDATPVVQGTPTLASTGILSLSVGNGATVPQAPGVTYRLRLRVVSGATVQEVTVDLPCVAD